MGIGLIDLLGQLHTSTMPTLISCYRRDRAFKLIIAPHIPDTPRNPTNVVHANERPFNFEKLPAEIMLRVMFQTPMGDLNSLVSVSKFTYATWRESSTRVFEGVQRTQFPEFEGLFGKMPVYSCLEGEYTRTAAQTQNLRDAIDVLEWEGTDGPYRQIETYKLYSNDMIYTFLTRYGGWRYLYFLTDLQDLVDAHLEPLANLKVYTNPQDGIMMRPAMLALLRL